MKRIDPDEWTAGVCRAHDAALLLNKAIIGSVNAAELVSLWIGDDLLEIEFTCDGDIDSEAQAAIQCLANETIIAGMVVITKVLNNDGIWKIRAVTGYRSYREAKQTWAIVNDLARILNCPRDQIVERVQQLLADIERIKGQIAALEQGPSIAALLAGATELSGVKLILQEFPGVSSKQMRATVHQLCTENHQVCAMLVNESEKGTTIVAGLSDSLVGMGISASIWVTRVAEVADGSGGGSKCIAQGGGPKTGVLPKVIEKARHHYLAMVSELLGDDIA